MPLGGFQTLARSDVPQRFIAVTRTTALARTTSYQVESLPGSIRNRTITAPDGTQALIAEALRRGNAQAAPSPTAR